MLPAVFGLAGERLTEAERRFFAEARPAGFILFARNCGSRGQLRALTDSLRALLGRDNIPILVDQEGGRVTRLGPPEWPEFPAAARFAELYRLAPISAIEAMRANALAIGLTLAEAGINAAAIPVLDLRRSETNPAIGDRALGRDPRQVAALGRAALDGLAAGGCVGVIKHMPGQGRAAADSHAELPVVDAPEEKLAEDLAPFSTLRDAPAGMVAHVLYQAWDAERPASLSAKVIGEVIRGRIGFEGLLISDDIGMGALHGPVAERARGVVDAGCDLALHCSGALAEMEAIAAALGTIGADAETRLERALAPLRPPQPADPAEAVAKRDSLFVIADERKRVLSTT